MPQLYVYDPETVTPPDIARAQSEEFLKASSPESREIVLVSILKELIEINDGGRCLIPFSTETEELGYYVPPLAAEAQFKAFGPKLSEERMAELEERRRNPGRVVPIDQAIEELRQEELRLRAEMAQQLQAG